MPESTPIILVRQRHDAKRAGLHYDVRMVVGDKAYSWATKKEMPEPGKPILLFEQPVHDASYALSQRIEIPGGQYGAGVTTLDFARKGTSQSTDSEHHLSLNNGDRYLIKKMPGRYGDNAWLFLKKRPLEYSEGDSHVTHLGNTYKVDDLLREAKSYPVVPEKVSDLEWVLAHDTPRQDRVDAADTSQPILVTEHEGRKVVVDGLHRLAKAKATGLSHLPAKTLPSDSSGRIVLNPYLEKAASMFERHKYLEKPERIARMISPVGFVKYDGANFFLKYDESGKPSLISRRKSVSGDIIDRTEKVPHLAKVLPEHAGEVYNVELIHTGHDPLAKESPNRLAGILNSGVAKSLKAQEDLGPIRAVVFDVISPGHTHYGTKYEQIKKLEKSFGDSDLLFAHEGHHGHEAVERLVAKTKAESREGVIAIDFDSPEIKNPRIKVKHRKHWNLRVTAIHEEFDKNGVPKGRAGSLELQDASGKNCGKAGTGFTAEMRKLIWENKSEWMGKLVKIEAMDPTSEKLRSPVYAGDADGHLDYVE